VLFEDSHAEMLKFNKSSFVDLGGVFDFHENQPLPDIYYDVYIYNIKLKITISQVFLRF
jgi:hypothetical protein